ncbi:unannotated protein [freshwater metagenome]|uniref:Unannotated protein n=1 Tax=freshwater metagenome TaxID=449393 RepID=A0A6J6UXK9_9ZZZZ
MASLRSFAGASRRTGNATMRIPAANSQARVNGEKNAKRIPVWVLIAPE